MHPEIKTHLYLPESISTQEYLRQSSLPPWSIVRASIQTGGRGRNGRRWDSPPGGLYYSLRYPTEVSSQPPALQIMGGALCWLELLQELPETPKDFSLKWPNDLLCRGKKIGGVLAEQHADVIDVGFGINVNNFFDELANYRLPPISLSEAGGRRYNLDDLLARWLEKFIPALCRDAGSFFSRRRIQDKLITLGREVVVNGKRGKAVGIGEQGELIMEMDGKVELIFAGDVEEVQQY